MTGGALNRSVRGLFSKGLLLQIGMQQQQTECISVSWNIAIVAVLTDFTNMAVMLSDLLRNLTFNISAHCTQVSDQCPLGLLLPNHFQTSHVSCGWWEEEIYWFWVKRSKVKVNFGTLCIRPCGHDSDYSFCPITFKFHMHIYHNERRNPIDFGLRGQRSRSTLALYV